jgi:hypothetical protein
MLLHLLYVLLLERIITKFRLSLWCTDPLRVNYPSFAEYFWKFLMKIQPLT